MEGVKATYMARFGVFRTDIARSSVPSPFISATLAIPESPNLELDALPSHLLLATSLKLTLTAGSALAPPAKARNTLAMDMSSAVYLHFPRPWFFGVPRILGPPLLSLPCITRRTSLPKSIDARSEETCPPLAAYGACESRSQRSRFVKRSSFLVRFGSRSGVRSEEFESMPRARITRDLHLPPASRGAWPESLDEAASPPKLEFPANPSRATNEGPFGQRRRTT